MKKTRSIFPLLVMALVACNEDGGGAGAGVPASPSNNAPVATSTVQNTGQRLNPPHGEPGHRCEIAVGEPLPDDGGSAEAPPQQFIQGDQLDVTTTVIDPSQAPAATSVKLPSGSPNPPHGSPGHDCNVAVGEPLP